MRKNSKTIIIFIILSHLAGLLGLLFSISRGFFIFLTPFHLIFMVFLGLITIQRWTWIFAIKLILIIISAFLIEWAGVKTGFIFGMYWYGHTLGWNLWGVPILIGFNWLVLILSSTSIIQIGGVFNKFPSFVRSLSVASLMVILDYFIEPVAVYFHYWHWRSGIIPYQNYIAWFVFSFLFSWILGEKMIQKNIPLQVLYISQLFFFVALNIGLTKNYLS